MKPPEPQCSFGGRRVGRGGGGERGRGNRETATATAHPLGCPDHDEALVEEMLADSLGLVLRSPLDLLVGDQAASKKRGCQDKKVQHGPC